VVKDLVAHGYSVVSVDLLPESEFLGDDLYLRADLTDYGQAVEVLAGVDAVVHLANIPAPDIFTPATTFNRNITMNFNVFQAAAKAGLSKVVWASSETTLGLPFEVPPRYAPVNEDHFPVPTTTYALSKVATETIAGHIAEWSGIPFIALRFSNILGPDEYAKEFPGYWNDPALRKWNLWGYIDERDVALSCRLALEADVTGSQSFIIAAADTVMTRPSAELMAEVFPGVPVNGDISGNTTLLSIDRAKQVLGFVPQHSWRDNVQPGDHS
jgi:nucleoside-diphosphate-sugar epimerase